jgi:hypothetical protein
VIGQHGVRCEFVCRDCLKRFETVYKNDAALQR